MGDGRDGLSEAVHLAAEKRVLADQVMALREDRDILTEVVNEMKDEAEWLRDKAMRYHDELAKDALELARRQETIRLLQDENNDLAAEVADAHNRLRHLEEDYNYETHISGKVPGLEAEVERLRQENEGLNDYADKVAGKLSFAQAEVERLENELEKALDGQHEWKVKAERLRQTIKAKDERVDIQAAEVERQNKVIEDLMAINNANYDEVERLRVDRDTLTEVVNEMKDEYERLWEENRLLRESKTCVHEFDIGGEG